VPPKRAGNRSSRTEPAARAGSPSSRRGAGSQASTTVPCRSASAGFKCPRCAQTEYCEIQNRQLLQCRRCRYQTSLIAGTILQGTKLPMRVWFRAMHLLVQGKKGLSNIELGRRLGISTNAAWRLQHKLMQAMLERDRRYKLGAAGPRIDPPMPYRLLKMAEARLVSGMGAARQSR
jgi:hypothetical protein